MINIPEQLSIFDVLDDVEKPEEFIMPDSFQSRKAEKKVTIEHVSYTGSGEGLDDKYTIRVFRYKDGRYVVSVSSAGYTFGYNSLEHLLNDWAISAETVKKEFFEADD